MTAEFTLLATAGSARRGRLEARARHRRDAGFHAGGHLRHGQGDDARRARGPGRGDRAGQHLSPHAAAGQRNPARAWRAARLHALAPSHPHRLRRLPGVQPRIAAQDHRGGRAVPLAHRRQRGAADARRFDGHAARAGLGHRDGARRLHALSGHRSNRRATRWSARCAGPRAATLTTTRSASSGEGAARRVVCHRAGRHASAAAPGVARDAAETCPGRASR